MLQDQDPQPVNQAEQETDNVAAETSAQEAPAPLEGDDGGSTLETLVGADTVREKIAELAGALQGQVLTLGLAIEAAILVIALAPAALFWSTITKIYSGTDRAPRPLWRYSTRR